MDSKEWREEIARTYAKQTGEYRDMNTIAAEMLRDLESIQRYWQKLALSREVREAAASIPRADPHLTAACAEELRGEAKRPAPGTAVPLTEAQFKNIMTAGRISENPHDLAQRLLANTTPLEAMAWAGYIRAYAEWKASAQ